MPTASEAADPVVLLVTELMYVMAGILLFSSVVTLALITFNKVYWSWYKIRYRLFTEWIVSLILSPEDTPQMNPQIYERPVLRDALVDLLLVMKGAERSQLRALYMGHGLFEQDQKDLRDRRWHVRLEALVRLDLWQEVPDWETEGLLLHDDNKTVRLIALKNLSRTPEKEKARALMEVLLEQDLRHAAHLYEIIHRLSENHLDVLKESLRDPRATFLLPTIMKIFGDKRLLETVPLLIEEASHSPDLRTRESALISLGKIEDPRGLSILLQSLGSDDALERLAALHSLVIIDRSLFSEHKVQLLADPDPLVAGWAHHYSKVQA